MKRLFLLALFVCGCAILSAQTYIDNVSTLAGAGPGSGYYLDGPANVAQFNQPTGVAVDAAGNVFVADQLNHRIRKITPSGNVSTFAGDGSSGTGNGIGVLAKFNLPTGIAIDNLGNLYVADQNSGRIRKITPTASVTTIATGLAAPFGLTVNNATGDVYVADKGTNRILMINAGGTVSVVAGSGIAGFTNGSSLTAQFNQPTGVALDSIGNIYVADFGNNCVRKITPGGVVSTFAGTGTQGFVNGPSASAKFFGPFGLTFDKIGNLLIADGNNNCIRKIDPSGIVSTFAGTGAGGFINGVTTSAQFANPYNITIDNAGNFYVADRSNHRVREISKSFLTVLTQTNVACAGTASGSASITVNGGVGPYTYSWSPTGGAVSIASNLSAGIYTCVVTDAASITATQVVNITQSASTLNIVPTFSNVVCNAGSTGGATVTATGGLMPYTYLWSTAATTSVVTNISAGGLTVTVNDAAGCSRTATTVITQPAPISTTLTASANSISIGQVSTLSVAVSGGVAPYTYTWTSAVNTTTYAVSPTANTIYTVIIKDANLCVNTGSVNIGVLTNTNISVSNYVYVSTFVGAGWGAFGDGVGLNSYFNYPRSSTIDAVGNLYIADWSNHSIRKVTPAGVVTTLAGTGTAGFVNGAGNVAQFNYPSGIAIDASGNLYVADTYNQRIRKVTPSGVVSTYAGSGTYGLVNGTSLAAQFANPYGVAIDISGNLYIADRDNNCIRKISSGGTVTTLAGSGTAGFLDATGLSAKFNYPNDVVVNSSGDVFVADAGNHSIRKVSAGGIVTTFAGNGTYGSVNGVGSAAQFWSPSGLTLDNQGNIYVAESSTNFIRKINTLGVVTNVTHNGITGSIDGIDTIARFHGPTDVSTDVLGNLYVVDNYNHCVRKLSSTFSATVNVLANDCFPDSTGSVGLNVSGGLSPYTYSWSQPMGNVSTATGLSAGTYSCIITDAHSLTNSILVQIGVDTICQHIWPGDANSDGIADNMDILELGLHFSQTGPSRTSVSNNWQSYFSYNWSGIITNGQNLNHSDCNGDGTINDGDTLAIYNNYGLTHAFKPAQTTTVNSQLSIVPDQAAVIKGSWGTASIYLGDATASVSNINGVAFTIDFDNTLIETNSIYIVYQNSFLDAGQNLNFRKLDFTNGKIFTASTHTINSNVSGFGKIATLHYQIKSTLTSAQVLNLGILQANQSDASGIISPLTSGSGSLTATTDVGLQELSGNVVSISPNPTNGSLTIHSKTEIQKIEVVSVTGQTLLCEMPTNISHTLHLDNFANGIYFVNLYQNNRIVKREKIVLNK